MAASNSQAIVGPKSIEDRYLELVKNGVMGALDTEAPVDFSHTKANSKVNVRAQMSNSVRSMIGRPRLDNIHDLVKDVLTKDIQGDFLEAGSWRGGACIFMKAAVDVYSKDNKRIVYTADLFQQMPKPNFFQILPIKIFALISPFLPFSVKNWFVNQMLRTFPNEVFTSTTVNHLMTIARTLPWRGSSMPVNTGLEDVKEAFKRYNLLDDRVIFLRGWFSDTLPTVSSEKLAILRADGDFYSSTMDIFYNLYERLSVGGYCIVDDYGAHPECTRAIDEFRKNHGITEEIIWIDHEAVYWKKQLDPKIPFPEKKWW